MNWLERARCEIGRFAGRRPANTADRSLTAVTAVPDPGTGAESPRSSGINGSAVSRQSLESDLFHRQWSVAWKEERERLQVDLELWLIPPNQLDEALWSAVNAWNGTTGDFRTVAELRSQLAPQDFVDRELMTPAGLALYCWTLWADGK